jgi:hypothetical protein
VNVDERSGYRSPLGRHAHLSRAPDPANARRAARDAWQAHGLILINPEWLGWADRKQAEILAEKLHEDAFRRYCEQEYNLTFICRVEPEPAPSAFPVAGAQGNRNG